jgi:FkbM family methyltransferase
MCGERIISVSNFKIKFEKNDPYWSRLISKHFRYELELENWLRLECSADDFFVDCGANIGYWSVFVSKVLNVKNFVAIEPNPRVFQLLIENLRLNNVPEFALKGAVGDLSQGNSTTSIYLDIRPGMHVGASIYPENTSSVEIFQVPSIQLMNVFEPAIKNNQNILLKLDVEGAEISCINQISNSIRGRVRIIYEDHGRDLECLTTKWLLSTNAYKIYFLKSSGSIEIKSIDKLASLKKLRNKGYNLVAIPV